MLPIYHITLSTLYTRVHKRDIRLDLAGNRFPYPSRESFFRPVTSILGYPWRMYDELRVIVSHTCFRPTFFSFLLLVSSSFISRWIRNYTRNLFQNVCFARFSWCSPGCTMYNKRVLLLFVETVFSEFESSMESMIVPNKFRYTFEFEQAFLLSSNINYL